MKKIMMLSLTLISAILFSFTCMANWRSDNNGWWYQRNDGSYPANQWEWIDGNNDGTAECYYFGPNGYMYANQMTPDGYYVDGSGAWIQNNIRVTKIVNITNTTNIINNNITNIYNFGGIGNTYNFYGNNASSNSAYNNGHNYNDKKEVLFLGEEDVYTSKNVYSMGTAYAYNGEMHNDVLEFCSGARSYVEFENENYDNFKAYFVTEEGFDNDAEGTLKLYVDGKKVKQHRVGRKSSFDFTAKVSGKSKIVLEYISDSEEGNNVLMIEGKLY